MVVVVYKLNFIFIVFKIKDLIVVVGKYIKIDIFILDGFVFYNKFFGFDFFIM